MKLENKALAFEAEIPDLKYKHVAAYCKALREAGASDLDNISNAEYAGECVRAAGKAGFLVVDNVDEANPALIFWLGTEIAKIINGVLTPPKNS